MKLTAVIFLGLMFFGFRAEAATYTVKPSGGNYSTIQACSNVAAAGDTCVVYAGTYAGWTQSKNGTSGSPVTFKANAGDTVTVNSQTTLSGRSYITVGGSGATEGFKFTSNIALVTANNIIFQNNSVTTTASDCMTGSTSTGSPNTYLYFLNNTFGPCFSGSTTAQTFYSESNYVLWDGNTFTHVSNGPQALGAYQVFRNNHFGPTTAGEAGSEHPDAVESTCYNDLVLQHLLYENNTTQEWRDNNGHGFLLRNTQNSGTCANPTGGNWNVIRFSRFIDVGSYFAVIQTNMPGIHVYNNSLSYLQMDSGSKDRSDVSWAEASTGGAAINNIIANDVQATQPWCINLTSDSTTGFVEGNNLCYISGYSGSWSIPVTGVNYASSDLFNQDPKFVNPTADLHVQTGSPAIGAGGALTTTVGSGTSSTALTVADAGFFSSGFGLTGVQPDWIRIGSSTTAQISSINYSTNVITLASPVSWTSGAAVYLYKDSSGNVVLNGASPDIGAYQSGGSATAPPPPAPVLSSPLVK